jgi:hypothetical protein
MPRRAALAIASLLLAACGTNRPEIPPELLNFEGGASTENYPAGPYGKTPGEVVENRVFFQGWMNPVAEGHDPGELRPISFADFYDPEGTEYELLLLNTAALWCQACRIEHGGGGTNPSLNEHYKALQPKGFTILSLLYEDSRRNPAGPAHLVVWTEQYGTTFPMALDPEYQMGAFQPDKGSAPYNAVIDARTMKILWHDVGDRASTMWPLIEAELEKRAAGGE